MLNKFKLIFLLLSSDYYIVPKKQIDNWIYDLDNLKKRVDTCSSKNVCYILMGRIDSLSNITRYILTFNHKK
jgi:hypothetical protein